VDVAAARSNLRDAIAWCDTRAGDAARMRTPELIARGAGPLGEPLWRLLRDPEPVLADVCEKRRAVLDSTSAPRPSTRDVVDRGRLLQCSYWASLVDVACNRASRGFLDEDDLPPAGTWIGLIPGTSDHRSPLPRPMLIAWIPTCHVGDVEAALPVCPMETNEWLDRVDPKLARALLRPD
jgi:hypothetical protein